MIDLMSQELKEALINRANNVISNLEACQLNSPGLVHNTNRLLSNVRFTLRQLNSEDNIKNRNSLSLRVYEAELWMEALAYRL